MTKPFSERKCQVSFSIPQDLYVQIDKLAKKEDRSKSQIVKTAIYKYLESLDKEH